MKSVVTFFVIISLLSIKSFAKELGVFGNVYKINEINFIELVKKQDKSVWYNNIERLKKEVTKEKIGNNYNPLPIATKNRSFYVDMTYTLDHDIPKVNQNGQIEGILYPKGFKFNPLDYITVNEIYIIINGKRKEEVKWVKDNFKSYNNIMVIISEGNVFDVSEALQRPVYFLFDNVKNRFNIQKTISVVYQEGKKMRVDEIYVPNEKDK